MKVTDVKQLDQSNSMYSITRYGDTLEETPVMGLKIKDRMIMFNKYAGKDKYEFLIGEGDRLDKSKPVNHRDQLLDGVDEQTYIRVREIYVVDRRYTSDLTPEQKQKLVDQYANKDDYEFLIASNDS